MPVGQLSNLSAAPSLILVNIAHAVCPISTTMDARDPGAEKLRRDLIALVRDLVLELHPQRSRLWNRAIQPY